MHRKISRELPSQRTHIYAQRFGTTSAADQLAARAARFGTAQKGGGVQSEEAKAKLAAREARFGKVNKSSDGKGKGKKGGLSEEQKAKLEARAARFGAAASSASDTSAEVKSNVFLFPSTQWFLHFDWIG